MGSPSLEILGIDGPGTSVTIDGVTWTLTRSTKDIQAKWSKWLTDRGEERAFLTADKYRERAVAKFAEVNALTAKYADADMNSITPEENARVTAERDKLLATARMLQAEARNVVKEFNDRATAGEFEYYGRVALDYGQQGLPGQMYLIWLCLLPKHPTVTLDEVVQSHMPDSEGYNHIEEWREALLRSEGVLGKKDKTTQKKSDS